MNSSSSTKTVTSPGQPIGLSVENAAKQLGLGRTTVYALIKSEQLRSVKFGKRRIVPVSAINEMMDRLLNPRQVA